MPYHLYSQFLKAQLNCPLTVPIDENKIVENTQDEYFFLHYALYIK